MAEKHSPIIPPDLYTPRLRLRRFTPGDATRVRQLAGDWQVAKVTSTVPHPYEDGMAEAWIGTHDAVWREHGHATWAVCLHDGGLVGCMSLLSDRMHNKAALGYWIGVEHWGRGYCTEAAGPVVGFGFDVLKLGRIEAVHLAENPASGRVMQKLGMTCEGLQRAFMVVRGVPCDLVNYGMLPGDCRPTP